MKGVLSRVTVEEVRGKEVSKLPVILLHLLRSKSSFELRPSDSKAKIFKLKILPWLLVLVSCERLSDLTMSPLLDYVSASYTPFSRLYCEPYFPGLGQSRGMSGGEFMLGKFLRARDWEVRWSQRTKKIGRRKNILHPRGCQMSQVWQCERWGEKVAGRSRVFAKKSWNLPFPVCVRCGGHLGPLLEVRLRLGSTHLILREGYFKIFIYVAVSIFIMLHISFFSLF